MAQPLPVQADIEMIAPELAGQDPSVYTYFINNAASRSAGFLCTSVYTQAVALLTAHLMTIRNRQGDSGQVGSKTAGKESISFIGIDPQTSFDQTSYGVEYRQLMRSFIVNLRVSR